ncbi:hypothetical protein M2352_003493 [Azospirillum fermentarium]|uniref:hypothetical protein n=1 Tax=Azospirillum fermentarium TaxID=1233114 RepID=UPI0022272838|nr:hypothetical protein [Azospirillum fermentarium]MCW2247859.1 hypothetical protein [Azospirillum fermentarium]
MRIEMWRGIIKVILFTAVTIVPVVVQVIPQSLVSSVMDIDFVKDNLSEAYLTEDKSKLTENVRFYVIIFWALVSIFSFFVYLHCRSAVLPRKFVDDLNGLAKIIITEDIKSKGSADNILRDRIMDYLVDAISVNFSLEDVRIALLVVNDGDDFLRFSFGRKTGRHAFNSNISFGSDQGVAGRSFKLSGIPCWGSIQNKKYLYIFRRTPKNIGNVYEESLDYSRDYYICAYSAVAEFENGKIITYAISIDANNSGRLYKSRKIMSEFFVVVVPFFQKALAHHLRSV